MSFQVECQGLSKVAVNIVVLDTPPRGVGILATHQTCQMADSFNTYFFANNTHTANASTCLKTLNIICEEVTLMFE